MTDDNMSIFDLGIPDVKTYKLGQTISKADAPRLIGQPITWEKLKDMTGKQVAKFVGVPHWDGDRDPWVICQILQFNEVETPEATAYYLRDDRVECPEHLTTLKYGPYVSAYIHDVCMPEALKAVYHIRKTEPNIYYAMKNSGDVLRLNRSSYDIRLNFFSELRR